MHDTAQKAAVRREDGGPLCGQLGFEVVSIPTPITAMEYSFQHDD